MAALYQSQPYLRETKSKIVSAFEEDDGRFCVALDPCVFYPQGGGQKGDRGEIKVGDQTYKVIDTVKDALSVDGRPLCILERSASELVVGQQVEAQIDWSHRYAQMRLHSIVHMHHCAMEEIAGQAIPVPVTSDLNSDLTAFNRYDVPAVTEELARQAFDKMQALVITGAGVSTRDDPEKPGFRYWDCLGFTIPCGGTHINDLREIGNFTMSFSQKKGKPKITFALTQGEK